MNFAPIIHEDLAQLEQTLLSRITLLRKQISDKQKTIEERVDELRKVETEDMIFITQRRAELLDTVNRFSAEIQEAQKNPRFDESTKKYLVEIQESLYLQLDQLGGPFAGFPRGEDPNEADISSQDTGDDDPCKTNNEERSDNPSGFNEDNVDQREEKRCSDNRDDFSNEEFIRMMREFEREQRLRDPFSQESLEALRQAPDDPDLRKLYMHLSKQIHPDLARTPEEAAQRTLLMQKLSHAYRSRDFATLLTIQETVAEGVISALCGSTDTISEDRITALRSTVDKLEAQLKTLKKHSNRMSRSSTGRMLKERREHGGEILERILGASSHLQELVDRVTHLIQQAAAGSLKMRTLRKKCDEVICQEDESDMDIDDDFERFMEAVMMNELTGQPSRHGRGRKRR